MVSILVSFFLGRKSAAQHNNQSIPDIHPLAALTESVIYKDDPESLKATQTALENWQRDEALKSRKRSYLGYNPCSCVSFAKSRTGYNKPVGNAKNWPVNALFPTLGSVVVINTGRYEPGHVAIIIGFEGNDMILEEANYVNCKYTSGRRLKIDDPSIIGFYIEGGESK